MDGLKLLRGAMAVTIVALGACGSSPRPREGDAGQVRPPPGMDSVASQIEEVIASGRLDRLDRSGFAPYRAQLDSIYAPGAYAPIWIDSTGAPNRGARAAIQALLAAPEDGLDSADYLAGRLAGLLDSLAAGALRSAERVGPFEVGLTAAFLRFLTDLHVGRVDPRKLGFKLNLPADRHEIPGALRAAVRADRVAEIIVEMRPRLALYGRVRKALAAYRTLAPDGPADSVPTVRRSLRPGDHYAGAARLRRRLVKLDDLEAGEPPPDSSTYSPALAEAVRRFQDRHGLEPDGVLGRATVTALNVTIATRIEQLRLSLERIRWLPDLGSGRFIVVNIPTYRLWAWDSLGGNETPALEMNVIVGKSLDTQTPVFSEEMRYLIFRPYWNVPRSILEKEMLPAIRRNVRYLDRNDLEIVRGQGDDGAVMPPAPANLKALQAGQLRLRQRPGPNNSLGLVKFMFPNEESVYLHSTPAQELFSRTRRDFSHGCVRVERPVDLAEWVLAGVPGWDRARIEAAMNGAEPSKRVNLARPVPVLLFYTTAIVSRDDKVQFFQDVYGHDVRLLAALRDGRP